MALKAVFFDFWKTVIDFGGDEELVRLARIRAEGIVELLHESGFDITIENLLETIHQVEEEANKVRFGRCEEVSSKAVVRAVLEKLGIDGVTGLLDPVWNVYTESLLAIKLELKADAVSVLEQLKVNGYRLGLISNTAYGEKLRTILKKFGIASYFDTMFFSDEFGIRKPRPAIFLAAVERLQVRPHQAVHIGDRVDLDVLGAKNAGLFSIYLNETDGPYPGGYPEPDITVHHLSEIPSAVEALNSMQNAN